MWKIIKMIQVGQRDIKNPALEPFKFVFPELTVVDGLVLRGDRAVVPNTLQNKIVNIAHEGHLGITKTKNLLRSRVWFPKMDKITEEVIRNCMACQVTTPQTSRLRLKMTKLPKGPMAKVSSDFYGPLPTGEYILLVNCLYSRYPMVRIVYSTSAKAVIPKLEEIFSEFGYPWVTIQGNFKITVRVMYSTENQLHQKSQKQMEHHEKLCQNNSNSHIRKERLA